jgi:hypothetical protein
MLVVFEKAVGKPPEELKLPSTLTGLENMKSRQEIGEIIRSFWPESMVYNLRKGNFMALSHENESPSQPRYYTLNLITNALIFFSFPTCNPSHSLILSYDRDVVTVKIIHCIFLLQPLPIQMLIFTSFQSYS